MTRRRLSVCLVFATLCGGTHAMRRSRFQDYFLSDEDRHDSVGLGFKEQEAISANEDVEELYFTQALDHFDPTSKATYQQRYFKTSRFLQKNYNAALEGDQILTFLCVGGEGPGFDKSVLVDSVHCSGDLIELAKKLYSRGLSVHVYALEHRYYGKSYPDFGVEEPLTVPNLKYLSSRQALEDLAHFVQSTTANGICAGKVDCVKKVAWITFGGSYPGYLAGNARYKYPHLISAAVSNSAPLNLKVDFPEYKTRVGWDLRYEKVGGSDECYNIVKQGHAQAAATPLAELAKMFNICDPENALLVKKNLDVLLGDGLIDVPAQVNDPSCRSGSLMEPRPNSQERIGDEGLCNIAHLCDAMVSAKQNTNATELQILADISRRQAQTQRVDTKFNDDDQCLNVSWRDMLETLSSPKIDSFGTRSWLFQTCTEVGFYQTCEEDCPFGSNFHLIDMDLEICQVAYNISADEVYANVQATLDHYGGLNLNSGASRILSVNGNVDPWSVLGLHKSPKYSLPVAIVAGASHHFWTHAPKDSDTQEIKDIRNYIHSVVMQWLGIEEEGENTVSRKANDEVMERQMLRG